MTTPSSTTDATTSDTKRKGRWLGPLVMVTALGLVAVAAYGLQIGVRMAGRYAALADTAMDLELEVVTTHVWIEEMVHAERDPDLGVIRDRLDTADRYAAVLLEGSVDPGGKHRPVRDEALRQQVRELREDLGALAQVAEAKLRAHTEGRPAVGEEYHQQFRALIGKADQIHTALEEHIARDLRSMRSIGGVLTGAILALTLLWAGVSVQVVRQQRRDWQELREREERAGRPMGAPFSGFGLWGPGADVPSPLRVVVTLAVMAGVAEAITMFILSVLPPMSVTATALAAPGILLVLLSPALFFFLFVPLIRDREALRYAEERSRSLIENLPVGLYRVTPGPEGRIVMANPAAARMLGYDTVDELCKVPVGALYQDAADREEFSDRLVRERGIAGQGLRLKRRDGTPIWATVTAAVVRDASGEPLYSDGMLQDMTERKAAEQALEESEERFRLLVDTSHDGINICEVDPGSGKRRLVFCNDRYVEMSGYSREELEQADDLNQLAHAPLSPEEQDEIIAAIEEGRPFGGTASWHRPDGMENYYEFSATAIRVGDRYQHLGSDHDITDRVRTEAALRYRSAFEALLSSISTRFISLPSDALDESIDRVLERVCDFVEADAAHIFRFSEDWTTFSMTHQWQSERIALDRDALQDLPVADGNSWMAKLTAGEVLAVPSVDDLPPAWAADRDRLKSAGIHSFVAVPLVYGERVVGMLGLDSSTPGREWSEDEVALLRMVGQVFTNALARKEAEEALRKSEVEYRTLFESMPDGAALHRMVYDESGRPVDYVFLELNEAFEHLTGLKHNETVGRRVTEIIPGIEDDEFDWIGRYGQVARTGVPIRFEEESEVLGRWYSVSAFSPRKDHFVALFSDVTDRKREEAARRQVEERFRLLVDTVPDGINICEIDPETGGRRLLFCNDRFVEMSGRTREELAAAEDLNSLVVGLDERQFIRNRESLTDHRPVSGVSSWIRPDGRENAYEFSAVPVVVGDRLQLMGVDRDITERRRAEEELRESREQLRALAGRLQDAREEEKKLLARRFHDDVGHALAALKMDLSWITRRLGDGTDDGQDAILERIEAMTALIDTSVRSVREAATELRPGVLDDFGLVAALEWLTEWFGNRSGIACVFHCESSEFDLSSEQTTAIFRICQELLTNVWQHSGAKEARVDLEMTDGELVLQVRDDGSGIAQEEVSAPESLGILGVRERALMLGGTVEISGVPGRGTTVGVHVPMSENT